jgi:hypothetical protein
MKIVIATGAGKTGKQIVIDAIVEDIETGKPLGNCSPGYYSAKIVGAAVIERGYREANEELRPNKPKAKGQRNSWGVVK